MLRPLLVTFAFLSVGGCATLANSAKAAASQCQVDGQSLRISGPTDQRMLDCLKSAPGVATVEMTSPGGSVQSAIEVGRYLKQMDADLVISDFCESSCANYILPAARSVRIRSGARLVLHGSVDAWAMERGASSDLFNLQRAYAEDLGITPGWLMMRSASDASANQPGRFLTTDNGTPLPANVRYIIVEPTLLSSCLPNLDVAWDEPSYVQQTAASASRMRRLERSGFAFSRGLRCAPNQTYPALGE